MPAQQHLRDIDTGRRITLGELIRSWTPQTDVGLACALGIPVLVVRMRLKALEDLGLVLQVGVRGAHRLWVAC